MSSVNESFKYHPPVGDQSERYERIRNTSEDLATLIEELCPPSRERSLAITNLEQASMWAIKSIAVNNK